MQQIQNFSYDELKSWLRDRLHERGAASVDIDRRNDEAAYELPLLAWKKGDGEFRLNLSRVLKALLEETCESLWPVLALHNLVALIEEGEISETIGELVDTVYKEKWLHAPDGQGPHRHMLALRTLVGLDWKGSPDFWLKQGEKLEGRYPALIFQGLLLHGPRMAFDELPRLVKSGEEAKHTLRILSSLVETLGLPCVQEMTQKSLPAMTPEAASAVKEWFAAWGYDLALPLPDAKALLPAKASENNMDSGAISKGSGYSGWGEGPMKNPPCLEGAFAWNLAEHYDSDKYKIDYESLSIISRRRQGATMAGTTVPSSFKQMISLSENMAHPANPQTSSSPYLSPHINLASSSEAAIWRGIR